MDALGLGAWNVRPVADPRRVTPDLHFPSKLSTIMGMPRRSSYQLSGVVISGRNAVFLKAENYLLDQFSCERQILNDTLLQSSAFWVAHCSVFVRASSFVSTDCVSRLASVSQCRWRQSDVYLEHLESSSSLVRWVLSKDVIWGQLPKVLCWDFHFLPH